MICVQMRAVDEFNCKSVQRFTVRYPAALSWKGERSCLFPMSTRLPLNWCFSTLGCPELSFESAADLAAEYDFGSIEIRALERRLDLPEYLKASYGSPDMFGKAIQAAPIDVRCLNSSLRLTSDADAHRESFMEYARWADGAGIPALRAFDGGEECDRIDGTTLEKIVRNLEWWNSVRASGGMKTALWIETHWSLCAPESVLKLVEAAPCELRIIWDVFHPWRHGGRDPIETWHLLKPHIAHIHFKDAVLDASSAKGARHTPLGEGEVPLKSLFDQLSADGFTGAVSFEWERYWNPELAPLKTMLASGQLLGYWSTL